MPSSYYKRLSECRRIGLLDSGVGGLTVLSKLKRLLGKGSLPSTTERQFIYLGDTARCPYGNREPDELVRFVTEIVGWLTNQGVDGIVLACNTSASVALEVATAIAGVPVFDLIGPTADYVAQLGGKVVNLATAATAKSRSFSKAIHKVAPDLEVLDIGCPELVPIIERAEIFLPSTVDVLRKYADLISDERAEIVVWGCTHFPFLKESFTELLPKGIIMIDPADVLCGALTNDVRGEDIVAGRSHTDSQCTIYVTGDCVEFGRTATSLLGYIPGTICSITTDELVASPEASESSPDETDKTEKRPAFSA